MRVLITGGTGSFGRAMTQKLLEDGHDVCCLSRGEHAQHDMEILFKMHGHRFRRFLGDVRDRHRLVRAFAGVDVVIHAAALKRIEVGRYNPTEVVKTNVDGSMNVIEAAMDCEVPRVVFLSSDKAYQPVSTYGITKALAETLFLNSYPDPGNKHKTKFVVTRYGNVWKSQGSVVPHWQWLLDQGVRRLPVTDPDATRFFMTMDEALDLVWTAATQDEIPTSPIIPELPAYRLGDIVAAMSFEMEVIGMKDWEKKHEGMKDGMTSDVARRMTIDEIRSHL